ncbi:MAG: DUF1634 domain-containing protein [Acidimicrobiales bacterium]|jgi:uncharacterized membrane protein
MNTPADTPPPIADPPIPVSSPLQGSPGPGGTHIQDPATLASARDDERVRRVELIISLVLRIGVVLSLVIVAIGLGITFAHNAGYTSSGRLLHHLISSRASFPHTLGSVASGVGHMNGNAIVVFGLILLILTPVMRVAVSIFTFIYQHDPRFVVITSTVLAVLITSFFLGRAGAG